MRILSQHSPPLYESNEPTFMARGAPEAKIRNLPDVCLHTGSRPGLGVQKRMTARSKAIREANSALKRPWKSVQPFGRTTGKHYIADFYGLNLNPGIATPLFYQAGRIYYRWKALD